MKALFVALALLAVAFAAPIIDQELFPDAPAIPDEDFGYVDVANQAHMFYVMYAAQANRDTAPLILWLQGGPGGSSVGFGNFGELGPLDVSLNKREYSWNRKANLLFVDQPVGTGYSYVDSSSAYTRNQAQIDAHLLTLMKAFLQKHPTLQKAPFYVFCESYGGKMAASFGVALHKAIQAKEITINFKGVGLGDSWIDPVACMESYGPFLSAISEITEIQQKDIDAQAAKARTQVEQGKLSDATNTWGSQQRIIMTATGGVNFYNYMEHGAAAADPYPMLRIFANISSENDIPEMELDRLMNGEQKKKWNIPSKVTWGGQSNNVFQYLSGDFMNEVVSSVDALLDAGYKVAIYNGALDVIVDTPCVTAWMKNMKWSGLSAFHSAPRVPIYYNTTTRETEGFRQIYKNLQFWTFLKAGHMVPSDVPELSTQMIEYIMELK